MKTDSKSGLPPAGARPLAWTILAVSVSMLALSLLSAFMTAEGLIPPSSRFAFRGFCHGLPDRCLMVAGERMPICARCTGIYAGALAGAVAMLFSSKLFSSRPGGLLLLMAGVALLSVLADGATQAWGLRESTNGLRLLTGGSSGLLVTLVVLQHFQRTPLTGPPSS